MAGGKGTRLAGAVKNVPKPMAPLGGRPLLERQVENLRRDGICNIVMVIGHLGDVIRSHFGNGERFGVSISYYAEQEPLGTAGALARIKGDLEDAFVLVFGDLFLDVSFQRFIKYHREKGAQITLFAHPNSHPADSDILVADADGRVTGWSDKGTKRERDYENLVNAGLYVVEKRALERLPASPRIDLEKQLIKPMIPSGGVYAYRSTEYVKDIGTPERLLRAERDLRAGISGRRNLSRRQKCIFLDRDGTINRYVGFLREAGQMELEAGAAEAIRMINESEYLAVVVTNQPVLARGECDERTLAAIHNRMYTLLGERGAFVDALYYCPHHPDRGFPGEVPELKIDCDCRKPKPGMLLRAAAEHNISLEQSWMIGDTALDIETGINAGTRTALIRSGDQNKKMPPSLRPDIAGDTLLDCVRRILSSKGDGAYDGR